MQIDRPFLNMNNGSQLPIGQQSFSVPVAANAPSQHTQDMALKKQCQEFESVLIGQMFKQMRPKADEEDMFGNTKDREMFNEMLDGERAKIWAQEGGIGLASVMFQQMKDTNKKM
ncbi:MAG: rod-binding protein [Candidatus Eremiobacterota bacterium]